MEKFLNLLQTFAMGKALPAIITTVVGILIVKLVMRVLQTALSKLDPAFTKLLLGVIQPVLYLLLCLIVVASLGIDVTSIVALASVLTLAISLSLQNALSNIFGGFTLLYTKPFVTGDFVEIAGQSGTVKEVGLAYTRLATPDNKLTFIPNSAVVAAQIVNYSTIGTRRLNFEISVDYNAQPADVIAALVQAGKTPQTLADPAPSAALSGYGEGTALYTLFVWTGSDDYWTVNYAVNENIKSVFAEKGIAMSSKHLNVNVTK